MTVHERIRQFREAKKLTHQQFADAVGVSRGAVQQWEKEDGTAPNRSRQPAVAKFMGISIEELMATTIDASGSASLRLSDTGALTDGSESNHAPAQIQQAQPAINNAVSLTMALATLQDALRNADPLDRASCKPYIAAMFDDPDRVDLVHRIVTALDPPSHKATPETGALRRTA